MSTASVVGCLLAGEAIARIAQPPPNKSAPKVRKTPYEHDRTFGWRLKPGQRGVRKTKEYDVVEAINSRGIRGPEYSYEKPADTYRILAVGDSFVEGYTVSFDATFGQVLERKLNARTGRKVQVISAGVRGYSTDQELLHFTREGRKYSPDLTVLIFYQNDVFYNNRSFAWRGAKPYFELGSQGLELRNVPVPKILPASRLPSASKHRSAVQAVREWFANHCKLYCFVRQRIKQLPALHKLAVKSGLARAPDRIYDRKDIVVPPEWWVFENQYVPTIQQAWKITEALLVEFKKRAEAAGSQFLVFDVPPRMRLYADEWEEARRHYGMYQKRWSVDRPSEVLTSLCAKNDIPLLDPIARFRSETKAERLYFKSDGHWNAAGHRVVADILAQRILPLVGKQAGPPPSAN